MDCWSGWISGSVDDWIVEWRFWQQQEYTEKMSF